jgi:hypothetical protein
MPARHKCATVGQFFNWSMHQTLLAGFSGVFCSITETSGLIAATEEIDNLLTIMG